MTSEKLCVFCKHWKFDGGQPYYSDLTPGLEGRMSCDKEHYTKDMTDIGDEDEFRTIIKIANTCADYKIG